VQQPLCLALHNKAFHPLHAHRIPGSPSAARPSSKCLTRRQNNTALASPTCHPWSNADCLPVTWASARWGLPPCPAQSSQPRGQHRASPGSASSGWPCPLPPPPACGARGRRVGPGLAAPHLSGAWALTPRGSCWAAQLRC
jgi:hypothetical protein